MIQFNNTPAIRMVTWLKSFSMVSYEDSYVVLKKRECLVLYVCKA